MNKLSIATAPLASPVRPLFQQTGSRNILSRRCCLDPSASGDAPSPASGRPLAWLTNTIIPSFYRLFNQAVWNWDELARIFLVELLREFVPGTKVWIVVDDTLCHKRGAKVAFGGIFLDAVLSSRKHKIFRFGVNWVTLGVVVALPFRKDRFFCINLLWRVYSKEIKGLPHKTKSQLARQMVDLLAIWLPGANIFISLPTAPISTPKLLRDLPANVQAVGPIHPKANLTFSQPAPQEKAKNAERLPTPTEMMENPEFGGDWDDLVLALPTGKS